MAELVQQRIEDRLPGLEQLERVGLFTQKEIKCIIKRATALEYKVQRLVASKEAFLAFIQYEVNVLELIKKRRAHIHYSSKREEIEFPIIQRINSVFRRATSKWKDDIPLWLSHVAFCKKWGTKSQISKVFSSVLAIHPDKPALWIMAAKSELEDKNSSESARQLFLRALRFHPNNNKIYQEYFRMELLHCEKLRKQKMDLEKAEIDLGEYEFSPEILSGKLAEIVYKNATQKINDAELVISLLKVAACFDFAKELHDNILQNLQSNFAEHSATWDFLARRELEVAAVGEELPSEKGRASDLDRRERRCCQVYEEGVKTLSTEPMWSCYVAFCVERQKKKTKISELKEMRKARLLDVLQRAHDASMLKEDYYKTWLQLLFSSGDTEAAASVAIAATQRYSCSVPVWSLSLQILIQLGSKDVSPLFQESFKHIDAKESLPIWQLYVQWSSTNQQAQETEAIFKRGLLSAVPAVAMEMKESYLDWSYSTGGYKKARKVFTSLQECRPLSKSFFTTMIQIEKQQEKPKISKLRDYYERALQEFGSSDEELWLEYIKEEQGELGQPENCAKIHWRAMKFLEGESVEHFTSKYTLLQTGHY
ncbi:U3 small nucleolar RNA-associated protein 6 homolog isoform 1-T3 [Synchiropus picturatus]